MAEKSQALFDLVFESMEDGQSLRKACQIADVAPSTFLRWIDEVPELVEQYTRARARMLDAQAEMLEEIGEQATTAETAVEVAGLRLLSDNRKWLLSKLAPKKYGDKIQTEHSGGFEITSKEQRDAAVSAALAADK